MWYLKNTRVDIRPEFIEQETRNDAEVHEFKLTKRFIDWLFRHYFTWEFCINFFDQEESADRDENGGYIERPATWDERMRFNNWQDPFGEGIWRHTQRRVDEIARMYMNQFRKAGHLKNRCWIGRIKPGKKYDSYWIFSEMPEGESDLIHIYLYGRDIHEFDFHFIMKRRGTMTHAQYNEFRYNNRKDPCLHCEVAEDCGKTSVKWCCDKCWYVKGRERDCSACEGENSEGL